MHSEQARGRIARTGCRAFAESEVAGAGGAAAGYANRGRVAVLGIPLYSLRPRFALHIPFLPSPFLAEEEWKPTKLGMGALASAWLWP